VLLLLATHVKSVSHCTTAPLLMPSERLIDQERSQQQILQACHIRKAAHQAKADNA